jgi:Tfp pilus assembly protein PilV
LIVWKVFQMNGNHTGTAARRTQSERGQWVPNGIPFARLKKQSPKSGDFFMARFQGSKTSPTSVLISVLVIALLVAGVLLILRSLQHGVAGTRNSASGSNQNAVPASDATADPNAELTPLPTPTAEPAPTPVASETASAAPSSTTGAPATPATSTTPSVSSAPPRPETTRSGASTSTSRAAKTPSATAKASSVSG